MMNNNSSNIFFRTLEVLPAELFSSFVRNMLMRISLTFWLFWKLGVTLESSIRILISWVLMALILWRDKGFQKVLLLHGKRVMPIWKWFRSTFNSFISRLVFREVVFGGSHLFMQAQMHLRSSVICSRRHS